MVSGRRLQSTESRIMRPLNTLLLSLSLFTLITFAEPARILCIYPVPFHSHQKVFHVLTEALAKKGHELVVLSTEAAKPMINVTDIDIHDKAFDLFQANYMDYLKDGNNFVVEPVSFWRRVFHKSHNEIIEAFLQTPAVQALFQDKNQHFDVVLTEAPLASQLVLTAPFDAPVILMSSFFAGQRNFLTMGAPVHPILMPDYNALKINNLSLLEKLSSAYNALMINYEDIKSEAVGDELIHKYFGDSAPTINELKKNIQLMIMNVHQIWDNNRPVPPSMVYMGALHLKKPDPIPKELQSYLDSCKNGVIYLSLGSKIRFSDLSPETIEIFVKALGSLPYNVLIKWNGGEFPNKPANIRLEKWLPQNDMLHHPSIKVFVTQAGLQSTDEAIAAKVPLIGLPVFADQFYNAEQYVKFGIGQQLDFNALSEDGLRNAIVSVAGDISYRENIQRLSDIMAEQRAGGLEKAIYWIEYTAKYGAEHLRSPLANMSVADYFMLDVFALVAFVLVIIIALIALVIRILLKQLTKTNQKSHEEKSK